MQFGIFNAAMLFGLCALALPIIAHFLRRRQHQVVVWGAMQFLRISPKSQKKFQLSNLLLLLTRCLLLAFLCIALCRPWTSLQTFGDFSRSDTAYVIIVDGSGSMAHRVGSESLHQRAVEWGQHFLNSASPQDFVSIIDARRNPIRIGGTSEEQNKGLSLQTNLPSPTGSSSLPLAVEDALKILAARPHRNQKILILTDGQKSPWHLEDGQHWERIRELRKQSPSPPTIEFVQISGQPDGRTTGISLSEAVSFALSPLEFSREMTVPGFPLKVRSSVTQFGGKAEAEQTVQLFMNGQKIHQQVRSVTVPVNESVPVEFEVTFPVAGDYVVSLSIEPDSYPADDQADGVVTITPGLPVLIVDGDQRQDPTLSESFFLRNVFSASHATAPWINAKVIQPAELTEASLLGIRTIFLLNVRRLSPDQINELREFLGQGGGIIFSPGNRVDAEFWNAQLLAPQTPFLPYQLDGIVTSEVQEPLGFDLQTLESNWLSRFRGTGGSDFGTVRFQSVWSLKPHSTPGVTGDATDPSTASLSAATPSQTGVLAQVLAQGTNKTPLIVSGGSEAGEVIQLAFPLDAEWGTFPAKGDFVPFIYELAFRLIEPPAKRNLNVGETIQLALPPHLQSTYAVTGPAVKNGKTTPIQHGKIAYAIFRQTQIPGLYELSRKDSRNNLERHPFVVRDLALESDNTPLSDNDLEAISLHLGIDEITSIAEGRKTSTSAGSRSEKWWLLMLAVLGFLILEAVQTSRIAGDSVQRSPAQM